jgi:N-acetylglutamate synthase-like GNAT family acetyltransferase
MVEYACREAARSGARRVLALTTQARGFFREICGFAEATVDDLPEPRKSNYVKNGRNSKILLKELGT